MLSARGSFEQLADCLSSCLLLLLLLPATFFIPAVCAAGYGKAVGSTVCTLCPYGTFQPGTDTVCQACPAAKFYTPVVGLTQTYESASTTTYPGAFGEEACVPKYSQLSPEAGQAYLAPSALEGLFTNTSAASLADCINSCDATQLCWVQYDAEAKQCWKGSLAPVASDANDIQVVYKLPPSTLGSASSLKNATQDAKVGAKMMSSGYYAHGGSIPDPMVNGWMDAGSHLSADARTFTTEQAWSAGTSINDCKKLCDNSNLCWGFVANPFLSICNFRGGVDALKTNAFFGLPTAASVQLKDFKW
jgi:hypothetical protein